MTTTPTILEGMVKTPDSVQIIHNAETVNTAGKTTSIYVGDATQVTLLIKTGAIGAGTPIILYNINVIESISGAVVKTYAGTAIATVTTDYILVSGVTLGDYVNIEWTSNAGSLNGANYFTGVTAKLIIK
jgi:hypothetical protein